MYFRQRKQNLLIKKIIFEVLILCIIAHTILFFFGKDLKGEYQILKRTLQRSLYWESKYGRSI